MTRLGLAGSISVLLLASASPGLAAGEDTPEAVLRDCGERGLPRDMVSTCLERARLVNEQAPSSALRDLQSRLEQRARTEPGSDLMPPPRQRDGQVYSQPLPENGATSAPAPLGQYAPPPRDQGLPPVTGPGNGYDGEDNDGYGDDRVGPPPPNDARPYDAQPNDNSQQQAAPYDDSDEPPIEGEDDGYDNSLPDPGYDTPDAPDPDWPPPGGGYDDGTNF